MNIATFPSLPSPSSSPSPSYSKSLLKLRDQNIKDAVATYKLVTFDMLHAVVPGPRSTIFRRLKILAQKGYFKAHRENVISPMLYYPNGKRPPKLPDHRLGISLLHICLDLSLKNTFSRLLLSTLYELPSPSGIVEPDLPSFFIPDERDPDTRIFTPFEWDLDTEKREDEFASKCKRYFKFWDTHLFQPSKQAKAKNETWANPWNIRTAIIPTIVPTQRRMQQLIQYAREACDGTRGLGLFWFKVQDFDLDNPDPILKNWITASGETRNLIE